MRNEWGVTFVRVAALVAALAAGPLMVHAQRGGGGGFGGPGPQGSGPGGAQRPDDTLVFRDEVTVVHVDAYVTDAQGRPVTDLTRDDFEVIEAGQPRTISTFASVNIPIEPPVGLPADDEALPDVVSNAKPPSRTYLFALDETAPDRALRAREFLRRFIDRHLGPDDVAAVALTGRGLASSGQDFTTNRRLLLSAIDKFSGGFDLSTGNASTEGETQGPAADRAFTSDAVQVASSLRKLTEFLATLPGKKTLVYVGEGFGGIDVFSLLDYKGTSLTPAGYDAHAAIAAATRGNVTIYPVDPRGLTSQLAAAESLSTADLDARADLAALAEATGGFSVTSSNNYAGAFDRIVQETSSYYTIGFNSEHKRLDGRFVSVQVRVKRPGLQVRSRPGYVAPIGQERRPERVSADTRSPAVADALSSAVATGGVPLRVAATPYRSGTRASVALAMEIDVSTLGLVMKAGTLTGNLEVSYLATDSRGRVRPGRRHATALSIRADASDRALKDGVRVVSEFLLPYGRYQLRVAAGSAGAAGSVVYDLDLPDFRKEPLMLSGVSMTSASAARVTTLKPNDSLGDALPGPPTATRDFSRDDTIAVYAELYDNRGGKGATPIDVTWELRGDGGRVIPISKDRRAPNAPKRRSGGHGLAATLALQDVPPGQYVVRVDARAEGGQTVSRGVPIRVR